MRFHFLVVCMIIALLAVADAKLDSNSTGQESTASDSLSKSRTLASENYEPRISQPRRNKDVNTRDTEERGPNVDHWIQDVIHAITMKTKWKLDFLSLKSNNQDAVTVGKTWGVIKNGIVNKGHPNYPKLEAYRAFLSK
ncbi:hypothetical protein PHMEG_00028551 [Phytophthora megakarya]|uniref:RxLR effector protein n=1 Tax=Phytophthora megakarya TaxID=4795 RepID=A0A225V483_9STRA|nr:hypothetical protein PHMEG_00028551 [Phytophthora megakarya]